MCLKRSVGKREIQEIRIRIKARGGAQKFRALIALPGVLSSASTITLTIVAWNPISSGV